MFAAKDTLFTRPSGSYQISRSVRLRASASAYFNRTPASATNRKTWTWSAWVKRGSLGSAQTLFNVGDGTGTNELLISFPATDIIRFYSYIGAYQMQLDTTQVFRDPSAWYHIVVSVDTTQATASNRAKLYVNGSQITAFSTATYPSQNYDAYINITQPHSIGRDIFVGRYFDGYLTEINFIDGQALTPSSFGETNAVTGVWQPKKYSGTYGTNGFYLNFSDNSNNTAATIGKDYSGNGNNWTPNNISVTAGVTYDSMIDVPTLYADGNSGRGNYAVLNPLKNALTLSAANLNWVGISSGVKIALSSLAVTSGKWYFEAFLTNTSVSGNWGIGLLNNPTASTTLAPSNYSYGWILFTGGGGANLTKYHNSSGSAIYSASNSIGATIGVAFDVDTGKIWFSRNNVWLEGDPSTGSTPSFSNLTGTVQAFAYAYDSADQGSVNFGQRPFTYTPPTGFKAINTQNLPAPTISNGANYMAATTYTGTGSSLTVSNAVNGISFKPDWVWIKRRNGPQSHQLYDVIRGVNQAVYSNLTSAEVTEANGLSAFTSSGFTVISDIGVNTSGGTYVGWNWKASNTTASNTNGSITSTVSAGATQGFSVVQFTATGATATVGHGLGVAPQMIIVKDAASAGNWAVWHTSLTSTAYYLFMNTTAAQANTSAIWTGTPSSTTFGIGSWHTADRQIAYCFAQVAGYSAFGSYTGNGSADGPFVFLGFRPRFIMIKASSSTGNWTIVDTSRDTYNVLTAGLYPNLSNAESNPGASDILSNGFKMRNTFTDVNGSGTTYIYMAFAENPFKISLAR